MAKIIENGTKRRLIKLSVDDVLNIISQYQTFVKNNRNYDLVRKILSENNFYIPEDL